MVSVWWNLFPLLFWYTPAELFWLNVGVLPEFIFMLPALYIWNFPPFFLAALPWIITGGLFGIVVFLVLLVIWILVIIAIFFAIIFLVTFIIISVLMLIFVIPFVLYIIGAAGFMYVLFAGGLLVFLVLTTGVFGLGIW